MISMFNFQNMYCVLAFIVAFFWLYKKSRYTYWKKLNVKFIKPIPFFGNTAKMTLRFSSFNEQYHYLYKELGDEPFAGIYHFNVPQLLVRDPELISAILTKDFKYFHDRELPLQDLDKKRNPFSRNLLSLSGESWKILRKKITPFFTSSKLKMMHEMMYECANELNQFIDAQMKDDSMDFDSKELFDRLTLNVIGTCAFGIDCKSFESNNKLRDMIRKLVKPKKLMALLVILSTFSQNLVSFLKLQVFEKEVTNFFIDFIFEMIKYRRQNGIIRNDLLQQLMDLQNSYVGQKHPENQRNEVVTANDEFDEIDITANSVFVFVAGFETTASTLSFCLYELALNEKVQNKLRLEVQRTKDKFSTFSYECLQEMKYLKAVIKETLRKHPAGLMINRVCTEVYEIPRTNVHLPVGTEIIIPIWSVHHDWRHYPNPEVFDPDRFYGDNQKAPCSGTYIPFGEGPRNCIGFRFAEMEMELSLCNLIIKYDFKPCTKTEIPLSFASGESFLQKTKNGVWVNFSSRKF